MCPWRRHKIEVNLHRTWIYKNAQMTLISTNSPKMISPLPVLLRVSNEVLIYLSNYSQAPKTSVGLHRCSNRREWTANFRTFFLTLRILLLGNKAQVLPVSEVLTLPKDKLLVKVQASRQNQAQTAVSNTKNSTITRTRRLTRTSLMVNKT